MNVATETTPTFPVPSTSLHLQYVGEHMAVLVSELVVGCVVVWNGGAQSLVTEITPVSKCFVNVSLRSLTWTIANGFALSDKVYVRKMKTSRAVAYSPATTNDFAAQG